MQKLLLGSIVGGLAGLLIGIVFALGSLLASDVLRAEKAVVIDLCGGVAGLVGMFIGALSGAAVAAGVGSVKASIAAVGLGFMSGALVAPCVGLAGTGGKQLLYAAGGAMAGAFVMIWHGRWRQPIKLPTAGSGWRRWLQFRLSTLLAMLVLTSALLAMLVSRPVAQRRAVAAIIAQGGRVHYEVSTPDWFSFLLGDLSGVTETVSAVHFFGPQANDAQLVWLRDLPRVRHVSLDRTSVTDAGLEPLTHLRDLETLDVFISSIGDEGLKQLCELKRLKRLSLSGCGNISDAGLVHLKGLTELTWLYLDGASLSDAAIPHVEDLPRLRFVSIGGGTNVSGAGRQRLQGLMERRRLQAKRELDRPADVVSGIDAH